MVKKEARQEKEQDQMTDEDYARKIELDNDPDVAAADVAAAYFAKELAKREKN